MKTQNSRQRKQNDERHACGDAQLKKKKKKKKDADKNSIKRKQNIKPLRLTKAVSVRERSKGVSCIWGQYLSFFKISEQLIIVPVFFF